MMTESKMNLISYFGYGANASLEMIEAIIGRKPDGSDFYLDDYELCIQMWEEIPDKVQRILRKEWDTTFKTYCIRPAKGKRVFGKLWQITSEERESVKAWEFWYEPITLHVKTKERDSMDIRVETEIINDFTIRQIVDGESYTPFLNDKRRMLKVARRTRERFLRQSIDSHP